MEDMARLALVEQSVKDENQYRKILFDLLHHISHILDNPHDYELRTIKSDILENVLDCEAFSSYLKYVGFEMGQKQVIFPREQTLSKLRMAQAALERKIGFCCGPLNNAVTITGSKKAGNLKLVEANILVTNNSFLLHIQSLFNNMIKYEDEELQQRAREHIPLVTLQLMALDRMREHQKKIKLGEIKEQDMSFDRALLMELLVWFKHKFFKWVDRPPCDKCGGSTTLVETSTMTTDTETCKVEVYRCKCGSVVRFPRHNNVGTLLVTRRGRCGEWANCFTLLCRSLGYDTRYIYTTNDHVWCEVFDQDSQRWLHVDPCEATLNAPLLYEHGWGQSLCYVVAFSRDDLQDVTWRYTGDHKAVLQRRTEVAESDLVLAILALRDHRQNQVSPARRRYLLIRNLKELVELMMERKPSDYEAHGRISGSKAWRMERGEAGTDKHTFSLNEPGDHCIEYRTSLDKYKVTLNDKLMDEISHWRNGVFQSENIFRKMETDWQQTYIAREEEEDKGMISWKLTAKDGLVIRSITVNGMNAVYENGVIQWSFEVNDQPPQTFELMEGGWHLEGRWSSCVVVARLSGGTGPVGWQHAQIGRQHATDNKPALSLRATVTKR